MVDVGASCQTLRPQDISAPRHFGTTKLALKFKPNHRWSCVSSELSWVEMSRLFLDHGTRVEVSRTTFLVSKCLETGAEVSQSVFDAEVSGNRWMLFPSGSMAQDGWLGSKVGGHLALLCIYHVNQMNSLNGCAIVTSS